MGGYLRVRALLGTFGFRVSQVPHPVWALAVCAVFTAVGVAVVDDYGVSWDEFYQRDIALETVRYVLGQDDELLSNHDKFYGTTFEMPLLIVERALGLQDDTRAFLLSRHILSHLFFIAGGFFCYLLIRWLFGSTVIALFAMLLFLLQPRLYAESFVNTKDLPLVAMFMVALFLTHRAFRKNTVEAFLLCGLAVGILINIRILGVVLFAAVPAVRALDLLFDAGRGRGRKHVLITGGVFALAAMFALYATLPYLWANPIECSVEMFATLTHHPTVFPQLFQGELIMGNDLPPHYIPTWIAITTPPVALLLGVAGIIAVIHRGWASPRVRPQLVQVGQRLAVRRPAPPNLDRHALRQIPEKTQTLRRQGQGGPAPEARQAGVRELVFDFQRAGGATCSSAHLQGVFVQPAFCRKNHARCAFQSTSTIP